MERLTYRGNNGKGYVKNQGYYNYVYAQLEMVAERLAAYEDTELEPDEIEQALMNFSAFLVEMTGGMMSKTNYTVQAMISEANDHFQKICDECGDRDELQAYHALGAVDELAALVKAQDEGRVAPCKVGDAIFVITDTFNGKNIVQTIEARKIDRIGGNERNPIWVVSTEPYELHFPPSEFGKTVFLTRAEAEAALGGGGDEA